MNLTIISQYTAQDYSPSWSTDGRLMFTSTRDGNNEIYEWDGVSSRSQMPNSDEYYPALWTP